MSIPPGYQRALSEQQVSTAISSNSTLFLSKERSTYVDTLRSVLSSAGFHNGNHILDLTGNSPGLVYAVGGKAIGWPWIHDVYPNSTEVALKILERVSPDDLSSSWIFYCDGVSFINIDAMDQKLKLELSGQNARRKLIYREYSPFLDANLYVYSPIVDSMATTLSAS